MFFSSEILMEWFDLFWVSMLHYLSLLIPAQDNIWLEEVDRKIQRRLFTAMTIFKICVE